MNKKILFILIAVILLAGGLYAGFGNRTNNTVENKDPVKLGLLIYPGAGLFYIAQDKGFFKQEGVNVEIVEIADETQMVSSIASNQVQLMMSSLDLTTIIADAGVDAPQIFAFDIGYGADGLVVKNDISDIRQLKGKKVYASLGTPSHFILRYFAEKAGLKPEDIELVNTSADQVGAFLVAGKIDYGMTWEPWISKTKERSDLKVFITSKDEPGIVADTIVARRDIIQSRPEELKRIMRAYFKAVDFWRKNKEEGNAIIAKHFNIPVEELSLQMQTVKPLNYEDNLKVFDRSNKSNAYTFTEKAIQIYMEDKILKSKPDLPKLLDPSLLKVLYQ